MIHLQVNPSSGVPVYQQVADRIRRQIDSGLLSAGAQLPSIRSLAGSLGVSPATIAKAYAQLEQEDIVEMDVQKWGRINFLVSRIACFLQ